jgi:CxxC motif-containing protein (DUF1111 family)
MKPSSIRHALISMRPVRLVCLLSAAGLAISCAGQGGDGASNQPGNADTETPTIADGVTDPGVRGGPPGAGDPIPGLNANELALFNEGRFRTMEIEATCDTCNDIPQGQPIPPGSPPDLSNSAGLGARFNHNSCTLGCHAQPSIGGTSPAVNPSFLAAKAKGGTNQVPWFDEMDGPTKVAHVLFLPDGTRFGGAVQKFTVAGRSDAPNCKLAQPDFSNKANLAFRIPLQLYGLGYIDSIQDKEIVAHLQSNPDRKQQLGIHGMPNISFNDGTIARFGWKAQNKSITEIAGAAYAFELGITNDLNPTAITEDDDCNLSTEPSDLIHTGDGKGADATDNFNNPINVLPVWMTFTAYMRYLDGPKPVDLDDSGKRGLATFNSIGCGECHVPAMQTKDGDHGPHTEALRGKTANLFSDLVLHHMGATLADNIVQGLAGPDQFRTTPLWGVGQRLFFLHDGRARTLTDAIIAHFAVATPAHDNVPAYPDSEANAVIKAFTALSASDQQDVINFLREL